MTVSNRTSGVHNEKDSPMAKGNPLNYDLLKQIITSLKAQYGYVILNPKDRLDEEQSLRSGAAIRFQTGKGMLDLWPSTGTWRITVDGYKRVDHGNALHDQVSPGLTMVEAWEQHNLTPYQSELYANSPVRLPDVNNPDEPPPTLGGDDLASYEAFVADTNPYRYVSDKMLALDESEPME